ncbi:MAG: carbohydrate ABC transporter permease, partial [Dermatophilaceae bacterium]
MSSAAALLKRRPARRRTRESRGRWVGLALTTPAWALLLYAVGIPVVVAVVASMTDESLVSTSPRSFVGLANYLRRVFASDFGSSLLVTILIIVLSVVIQMPLGLGAALMLANPLRGKPLFRGLISLPMILSPMAVGLMFRFIIDPDLGLIRWFASFINDTWQPNLLGSPVGALGLIVAVNSWI